MIGIHYLKMQTFHLTFFTVTKVKLDYVSNGIRYPVEIPNFDSLFDNDDDKKRKVLDSKAQI